MIAKPINSDDLNDPLPWETPSEGERPLPQDQASVRVRASAPVFEESCRKCGGTGQTRWGGCFACKGKGKFTFKTSPEVRAQQRDGRRQRAASHIDAFKVQFPNHWAWIERTMARTADQPEGSFGSIVRDLPNRIARYGDLHEGTMAMIERGMAKDAEFDAQRAQAAAQSIERSVEVDTSKIEDAFRRRREKGQIRIGLYYPELFIGPMRNSTALRVKASKDYEATYYGKIEGGRFFPTRACTDEVKARLMAIAADPAAAARVTGKDTGICCCCGLTLTNPVSIAAGIGPICAGAWGF